MQKRLCMTIHSATAIPGESTAYVNLVPVSALNEDVFFSFYCFIDLAILNVVDGAGTR